MRYRRQAYTLVELLVVIAIIGILLSISLPALRTTITKAHANTCANNLRSLAHATTVHELSHGYLPAFCQKYGEFAGGVDPTDPRSFSGNVPPHVKVGSWHVAILGNLDNQPIYELWTQDRYPILSDGTGEYEKTFAGYSRAASANIPFFQCPSASGSIAIHGLNNYIANTGLHVDRVPFTYTRPGSAARTVDFVGSMDRRNGAFNNQYAGYDPSNPSHQVAVGKRIRLSDFKDGLSNTMLLSENQQAQPWHLTSLSGNTAHLTTLQVSGNQTLSPYPSQSRYLQGAVWHFEDPDNYAGAIAPAKIHRINGGDVYNEQMNSTNYTDLARPSSLHFDGVNMAFADGSVRFVVDSIDYRTYQALLTPAGKASDVPYDQFVPTTEL